MEAGKAKQSAWSLKCKYAKQTLQESFKKTSKQEQWSTKKTINDKTMQIKILSLSWAVRPLHIEYQIY